MCSEGARSNTNDNWYQYITEPGLPVH
jgi:hypothetical protein